MPLSTALASLKNPAASRLAILQRLGIDPNRAAGYGGNTQFDQQMSDLYRQGLKTSTDLDVEEGNIGRSYQRNLAQAAVDRDKAMKAIIGGYAQRGMTYSGANVDEQAENTGNYTRYLSDLEADKNANIGAIGRNRLNLEEGITSGRMAAESGYGDDVAAFLQQQAIDLWNSTVQQNQQNELMRAMQAPAPRPAPQINYQPAARPTATAVRPALPAAYNVLGSNPLTIGGRRKGTLRGQGYGSTRTGPF